MSRGLLAVLVSLAACGDDSVHHLADAPGTPDAMIDASTSGPVTLTITESGTPRANVDVYFQAADGSLVAKVATNAEGVASATMMAGGFVTVVNPFPVKGPSEVKMIGGVKPGDQLVLKQGPGFNGFQVTLSVPEDPAAAQYDVFTTCGYQQQLPPGGGSGAPASGPVSLDGCTGNLADILVVTLNANGNPSRYLYKPGVTVTAQAVLDFSLDTYVTPVPTAQLTWTNVPAGYTGVDFNDVVTSTRGPLLVTNQLAGVAGTGATATIARPATSAGAHAITTTHLTPNGAAAQYVVDWGAAGPTATFDLASTLLGTFTAAPVLEPATRTITWTAGAGATPDFVVAGGSGYRVDATTTVNWRWDIAMPYGSASLVFPKLPADLDIYNFVTGDQVNVYDLMLAKVPGGYDAVRAQLLSKVPPESFAVGQTGRIVYETLAPPQFTRAIH